MAEDDALLVELRRRASNARRVASAAEIASAESELGLRLPPFLRRVYAEVADGGFGPDHGLLRLRRGRATDEERGIVETYAMFTEEPGWPRMLLPICDWGCAIWSCLDCRSDDGSVVTSSNDDPLVDTGHDLRSWLRAWLEGRDLWKEMFEPGIPAIGVNPFTRKPMALDRRGKPKGRPWS